MPQITEIDTEFNGLTKALRDHPEWLAADLAAGRYARPRELHPVPLLGIPGVTRASEAPEYYLDTWQFRPGRRSSGPAPF
mgnify:CR=1 FL=1